VRLEFSQPLAAGVPIDSARVRVLQLPDSTPVSITAILNPRQYDSLTAVERQTAKPDSAAARRDSTPARAPAARGAPAAARDTAASRDSSEVRLLLAQRPAPFDKVVLRFPRPLTPETRYVIRVRGAVNLSGAGGDGQVVILTPKPPAPAKADTANAPRSPLGRPTPRPPER
jgi:hypothetical protein